jgi:hypothetical protein
MAKGGNMPNWKRPMHAALADSRMVESAGRAAQPEVLTITADVRFYASVLNATALLSWRTEWARTLSRAIEIHWSDPAPIVICDINLPDIEWDRAFDRLCAIAARPRLLLAARFVDEDLWRMVRRHHGYDLVDRSASAADLSRTFRFAWVSFSTSAGITAERTSGAPRAPYRVRVAETE